MKKTFCLLLSLFCILSFALFGACNIVTDGTNSILGGALKAEFYLWTSETEKTAMSENGSVFKESGFIEVPKEPGMTSVAYFSVTNTGTLAFVYNVYLDVNEVTKNYTDVIEYMVITDVTYGMLNIDSWAESKQLTEGQNDLNLRIPLSPEGEHFFAIVMKMKESASNEYNGGSMNLGITITASQILNEEDNFDNNYDAN